MTQNKRKTPRPVPRKPITEDLERTIIDFDISDFEDSQEEDDQLDIPPLGQKTSDVIQNKTEDRKGVKKSEPVTSDILNQKKKVSKSLPDEDFDKTAIDIDVSQLEPLKELKEITGKVRIPIDETAIVNVTPSEDSGFFDDDFFNEEITGTHHVNMDAVAPDDASEPAPQQDETAYLEMSQDDSYEDPNLEVSNSQAEPLAEGEKKSQEIIVESKKLPIGQRLFSVHSFLAGVFFFLLLVAFGGSFLNNAAIIISSSLFFVVGAGLLVSMFLGWLKPRTTFLSMLIAWYSLVCIMGFYSVSAPVYYFFGLPLNSLFAFFFILIASVIMVSLVFLKKASFLVKIPGGVGWLFILFAFLVSVFSSTSFEGGFWSPSFFQAIPLYLRPSFIALVIGFPLLGISLILSMIFKKSDPHEMSRAAMIPLLLLCLMAYGLGIRLLATA